MNLILWITIEILVGYSLFKVHPYLAVAYALLQVRQVVINMIKKEEMLKAIDEVLKKKE